MSGPSGPVLNGGADRGWSQMSMGCTLVPVGGETELWQPAVFRRRRVNNGTKMLSAVV